MKPRSRSTLNSSRPGNDFFKNGTTFAVTSAAHFSVFHGSGTKKQRLLPFDVVIPKTFCFLKKELITCSHTHTHRTPANCVLPITQIRPRLLPIFLSEPSLGSRECGLHALRLLHISPACTKLIEFRTQDSRVPCEVFEIGDCLKFLRLSPRLI